MKQLSLICLALVGMAQTFAQQSAAPMETKYRRSSIYTAMIDKPGLPYAEVIKKNFQDSPVPDKFDDHNLPVRIYDASLVNMDDKAAFSAMMSNLGTGAAPMDIPEMREMQAKFDGIAREMVAKWFNRSDKGGFNMELIKQRGSYDASVLDIATAKASKRGLDMLADAGEELIKNTFFLVSDYKYVDKAEVAEKAKGWLNAIGTIGEYAGVSNASAVTTLAGEGVGVAGKGYVVKTPAYLYQVDWNEEVAAIFYNDMWADDATITPERKKAFDESTIFKLKFIGSDVSWSDVQSSVFSSKSEEELVQRASTKSLDAVIVKLQKNHDEFKTKTPLFTGEPITAKIGMKEGVTEKSKFDVLEQQMDENGKTKYVVVGSIKVDTSKPIWDNRFGANEENPDTTTDRTHFKKVSGKEFYPGMLIIQKKGK